MGIRIFGNSSATPVGSQPPPAPNPNPNRFTVKRTEQFGCAIVAEINYPDCTNYEGNKIIVFVGKKIQWIHNSRHIDPHFEKGSGVFARFVPTPGGWHAACECAKLVG